MEDINLRYILTRAGGVILVIVVGLYALGYVKKRNKQAAIVAELKSLSSDSSFFRQFYAEDARKSLVKAVGLIAEANNLGLPPETSINRGLGIEEKYFAMDGDKEASPVKETLVRETLRANYENFRKLGYEADFHTLDMMKQGDLPPVRTGPQAGAKAEVGTIIDPALSPGLDKVMANLEIRPPKEKGLPLTDVETATAKQLATALRDAGIIEEAAEKRIIESLTPPPPGP
ncbi:hypothetical protein HZ994_17815 [Akkermansiaceae bacterium]|nr:hypothetical protein HZ994_17815 [Akkermansiaceae bacterium]